MNSTIAAYEQGAELYKELSPSTVPDDLIPWFDEALSGLDTDAKIFEIGSGTGRDARYLEDKGYTVNVSDVASSFVRMLREEGWSAREFDITKDLLHREWDLVLADAVLLHLHRGEFIDALRKVLNGLNEGGRFAFTVKSGERDEYSSEKLGVPRYFCYWNAPDVEQKVKEAGYSSWTITEHPGWIHVVAYR